MYESVSDVTMCAQNTVTWLNIFNETGNLPCSASTGVVFRLLCMPRVCVSEGVWVRAWVHVCACVYEYVCV